MSVFTATIPLLAMLISAAHADPFGAPGIPHRWAPAAKEAVGTAYEATNASSSPVWFTVSQGVLTEVFYPSVDQAQISELEFLVTDGSGFFSEQKRDTHPKVSYEDEGMTVHIEGADPSGRYSYDEWLVTDPAEPVLRIRIKFHWNQSGLRAYVMLKPAVGNSGAKNLATATRSGLFATRKIVAFGNPVTAALIGSVPFSATSAGYVGFSDGAQELSRSFKLVQTSAEAGPGNVAATGELPVLPANPESTFDFALSFGAARADAQTFAETSLEIPFEQVKSAYEAGWRQYLRELESHLKDKRFIAESSFARRSAQIIKMHEDKRHRGAIVSSLSKPAIPDSDNAFDGVGGYHLVWPRDLYHAAMGLLAAGDTRTPVSALNYLIQHQLADGSWPQNFWVDGTAYWHALQMDEVAYPILLAAQLKSRGALTLRSRELEMVRKATLFIITHGPSTQEDRWQEIGGYSPDTLATEIAALRVATVLTGAPLPARVAEQWQLMIERWTLVSDGPWGRSYYLRASVGGQPGDPETFTIPNAGENFFASEILDGGFLNLVRMGVRDAHDPRILSTLELYESPKLGIALTDPGVSEGTAYRRYNHDTYGYGHVGGYWPVLAGEKGHYDILAGDLNSAATQLFVLEKSASETGLLPEQTLAFPASSRVGNRAEVGMGVAQPLVWAHAEDILLHRSIEEGKVFDAPRTP